MPTEENEEELVDRIALLRSSYISLWKKFNERWGVPFPMIFPTPRLDWYKIDEWSEDKIVPEISLEDLNKELEDNEVRGHDTDSIWVSEMEQNPVPPPVPQPMRMSELTGVGDLPEEVGRQINEAMERDFENRDVSRIRGTPNRLRFRFSNVGAIFLAHQNRDFCYDCERLGCSRERCESAKQLDECAGFVDKRRHEIPDMDCVICGSSMDSPENFPKGFPDKWKACCYCIEVWSINGSGIYCNLVALEMSEIKTRWDLYGDKMMEVFTL